MRTKAQKTQITELPAPGRVVGTCMDLWAPGKEEKGRGDNPPTAPPCSSVKGRSTNPTCPMPCGPWKELQGFQMPHTFGLFHDCGICRVHRFNLLRPPHALLTGCGCSWVPLRTFSTHHLGLGRSGPVHAENTPWRSRLQGVLQHFHVAAMIKRLLESRERHIPPMDSSGL